MGSSVIRTRVISVRTFICSWAFGASVLALDSTKRGGATLPLSPAPVADVAVLRAAPSTLDWEQKSYPVSEGTNVLVGVITDPGASYEQRTNALKKLITAGPALKGSDMVPLLVAAYDALKGEQDRALIGGSLDASEDERGLPIFCRFLSEATNDLSRSQAAYALSRWNIRDGVEAMMGLLESKYVGPAGEKFSSVIVKVLQVLNQEKGWGLDDQAILQRVNLRQNLTEEQREAMHIAEIVKWWSENKKRFPDWKPGDPLPANEPQASDEQKPAPEPK